MDFAIYVSFFPQLIAGPITRANDFLPQIYNNNTLDKKHFGAALILVLLGLMKKLVIADNFSIYIRQIYLHPDISNGVDLLLASYAYTFQIYCDFSGYTDIALGIGFAIGYVFPLTVNFNYPYLSKNPSEFWRKWHISLSNWFRNYLYIPLGGSRVGFLRLLLNLMIVMTLCGLWHGANITFVLWGIYHGLLLVIHRIFITIKRIMGMENTDKTSPRSNIYRIVSIIAMFHCASFGWIVFRAESLKKFIAIVNGIITRFDVKTFIVNYNEQHIFIVVVIILYIIYHVIVSKYAIKEKIIQNAFSPYVISLIFVIILLIIVFHVGQKIEFIYFQF